CGGRWQIPQDWAKTWRPNFCVAVNSSPVLACCADAPPAASTPKKTAERTAKRTPERTAERTAALRFILDPPDMTFLRGYAGAASGGRLDPERGGLTGMRSGRGAAETTVDRACGGDWRGYAVHRLRRRSCASAGQTITQDGVPQMLPRLAFPCMTAMAI